MKNLTVPQGWVAALFGLAVYRITGENNASLYAAQIRIVECASLLTQLRTDKICPVTDGHDNYRLIVFSQLEEAESDGWSFIHLHADDEGLKQFLIDVCDKPAINQPLPHAQISSAAS